MRSEDEAEIRAGQSAGRTSASGTAREENISELCRREGIAVSMYYGWSKELIEAGKRRLAGDTARAATSGEDPRRETTALKEVIPIGPGEPPA